MQANYNWEYCNKVLKKPIENKANEGKIVNSNANNNTSKPLLNGADRVITYKTFHDDTGTRY